MQKVILYLLIISGLLGLSSCARSGSRTAPAGSAQRFLKLRGYEFDEKGFFAAAQARDLMAIDPDARPEYDIRGIIGETLGADDARAIGRQA